MKKVLLIVAIFLIGSNAARAEETLFFDDFSRPDSDMLGNPNIGDIWTEVNESATNYVSTNSVRKTFIQLSSQKFDIVYDTGSPFVPARHTYAYASLSKTISNTPLEVSLDLIPHETARVHHEIALMDSSKGYYQINDGAGEPLYLPVDGVSIHLGRTNMDYNNSSVSFIVYRNGDRTIYRAPNYLLPFQFAAGVSYSVRFNINTNGVLSATISSDTQSVNINYEVPISELNDMNFNQISVTDTQGAGYTSNPHHTYFDNFRVVSNQGNLPEENEYPLYTQIESMYPSILETSDWEDDTFAYGSQEWCGDTVGGCGCAITSGVMAGRNADITTDIVGNDVNPKNINEYLRSVGGYTSDGSVYWLAMQAYLGELTNDGRLASRFQYVGKYEGAAAMSAVDQYLENEGEYAVLAFKNSLGHFIWLPAKTDDSYVVRDPFWYLTQTANDPTEADIKDYNDSFDSVRVFEISDEPVVASGSGVEAYLKGTAELIYKDATGSAVGYMSGGTVVNLPNSSYGNAEVIGLNGTPSPNAGGKHLLVSDASNEFTIEVIGTGSGGFEMEFFTISETGEVTTYTFSGQTIPGVTSTFTFNLETGEVKEEPISYEQFLNILSLQLDGYTDQQKAFFTKWAAKMYSDMEEKTVSQALQSISVYGKLLVAKKVTSPVLTSVLDLLTVGVKKR